MLKFKVIKHQNYTILAYFHKGQWLTNNNTYGTNVNTNSVHIYHEYTS